MAEVLAEYVARLIASLDGTQISAGIQREEGQAPNGDATNLQVAVWNHEGTRTIPARPWIAQTGAKHGKDYLRALRHASKVAADGGDANAVLRKIGVVMVSDLKHTMTILDTPPNAPSTIRKKKSANPLIDKGQLRQAHRAHVTIDGKTEVIG